MPTLIATAPCNPDPQRPGPGDRASYRVRLLTLGIALALHGAALGLALRGAPQSEPDQPPQVLQVRWISTAQPAPQPTPVPKTPVPKPAPAIHRPIVRPRVPQRPVRPLLSTSAQPADATVQPAPAAPTAEHEPAAAPPAAATAPTPDAPAEPPAAPMLTPPSLDAHYLSNPAPDYPPRSRELGEQGIVRLRIDVSAEGKPLTVEIHRSSGYERLDQAAIDAVQHWRFVPARRGALAVEGWVVVPISFNLRS